MAEPAHAGDARRLPRRRIDLPDPAGALRRVDDEREFLVDEECAPRREGAGAEIVQAGRDELGLLDRLSVMAERQPRDGAPAVGVAVVARRELRDRRLRRIALEVAG